MSYIADTWNMKQKTKVYINKSIDGYYIFDSLSKDNVLYMHKDGTFDASMRDKKGYFHYHDTYQDAIDCCVKHGYDYEVYP